MALKDTLSKLNKPIGGGKSDSGGGKSKSGGVKKALGGKSQKVSARNMPVKRSINLAASGTQKPIKPGIALPAVAIIVVAAILLSKFLVVDRLLDVSRAQSEVASVQSQLDASYAKLASFGEMTDEYAHYTYSNMTAEEMARTDRVEVLDLIQRVVLPQATLSSWSVTGNILTLDISRANLQEINLMAQQLNADPLVNFCTVTTAATNDRSDQAGAVPGYVTGQVVVFLNSTAEEDEMP